MAQLKLNLASRLKSKLGLISRPQILSNVLRYSVFEIAQSFSAGAKLQTLIENLEKWILSRLVKSFSIYFYSKRMIKARVVFSIDWDEHDSESALNFSVVEEGGAEEQAVYTSVSSFAKAIRERVEVLDRSMNIDDVLWTMIISDEAIAEHGREEAMKLADVAEITPQLQEHIRTFRTEEDIYVRPNQLKETILSYEEGTSDLRPK